MVTLALLGCQSAAMQTVSDCKLGDWVAIGHKDGHQGLVPNFNERRVFCSVYESGHDQGKSDSSANYQSGWVQGNWDLWSEYGHSDGLQALPVQQLTTRVASIPKKQAPANQPAYEAGWLSGNSQHWRNVGENVGNSGLALAQIETSRSAAASLQIRFDADAYTDGWTAGNRTYWYNAGFQDAHNGVPDSQLAARVAAAKQAGVLTQEAVYQSAWNAEIVNFWDNLGSQDAVAGKNFAMRKVEAQQKGLKIFEREYQQSWEARLAIYWRQVGKEDGDGHPFQLDARIARAASDGVFVISRTRELYSAAWEEQNARYCNVDDAFSRGQHNEHMAIEVCKSPLQGQLKRAYLSGQDYQVLANKNARVKGEIDDYTRTVSDTREKLARVDREIRSDLQNKQRVVNSETDRQDKQRAHEREVLNERLEQAEHQLEDARRREDQLKQQMLKLKRDIYLN
jgi:hypothetical protein